MFVLKMLLELTLLGILGAGIYLGLKNGFIAIMYFSNFLTCFYTTRNHLSK